MHENSVHRMFFKLLAWGLWADAEEDYSDFALSEKEWADLYDLACVHTVEAILYQGLQKLDLSLFPPKSLLLRWVVRVDYIEGRNKKMNLMVEEQMALFKKIGLQPIMLKGQAIAAYYPVPLQRVCGDIDWFFSSSYEYELANRILKQVVPDFEYTAGYSTAYTWNSFEVEHHKFAFDLFNPMNKRFIKKMEARVATDKKAFMLGDTIVYGLPAMLNILQVNAHILKHLRAFGIGFRQLCDAAILYRALYGQYDAKELFRTYQRLGILRFIQVLHHLLVRYIGLDRKFLPFALSDTNKSDQMLADILRTGNFGFNLRGDSLAQQPARGNTLRDARRLCTGLYYYAALAPLEALCFPIHQVLSRFKK